MTCRKVRGWLHRDATTLADADRLVLEDHLEHCERCREARRVLVRLRAVVDEIPVESIGPRGYRRAIANALLAPGRTPTPQNAMRPGWITVVAGLAVAATIVVAFARRGPDDVIRPEPVAVEPVVEAPTSSIRAGTVEHQGLVVPIGSPVVAGASLRAMDDALIALPGVTVALKPTTEVRWEPAERTVHLASGVVDVTVEPTAGLALRVSTVAFVVEVTGTELRVSEREVTVTRGSVRILDRDGSVLVERLAAGETWQPTPPAPGPTAADLIHRARRRFAADDFAAAERLADAALDAAPDRAETAEARTILADCAQGRGDLAVAADRYRAIAERFADLPAGETARFAAAHVEARRGRLETARAGYRRYLELYPAGRFADDARRALQDSSR